VTSHVPAVRSARLEPWPGADARLTLVLDPDGDRDEAARQVSARLAPLAPALVRGLDLAVVLDEAP
jgi:hypothetical protein